MIDDSFAVFLMSHDQYILEVSVNFEVEDVLSVEAEAVDEMDLGRKLFVQGDYVSYLQARCPHMRVVYLVED